MNRIRMFDGLEGWLSQRLGRDVADAAGVDETSPSAFAEPLLAFQIGERSMIRVVKGLREAVTGIVDGLSNDELYSVFGTYELGRVTLDHGFAVWGPSFYYFGDRDTYQTADTLGARALSTEEMASVDAKIFWHCDCTNAAAAFGIFDGDRLIALTTVRAFGKPVYEIDVDVAPNAGRRGLGRAVMSMAGSWILEQDGLILARTAPWNVPSARLLRSMGLKYALCDLEGKRGPFRVPPQPLGKPTANAEIEDLYPMWAQNQQIMRKD